MRGADRVHLLFVLGAEERVDVERTQSGEKAGHAGDSGRLAALVVNVDGANTLLYRLDPVVVVLETPAERSALVSVTCVESSVLCPGKRGSN